MKSQAYSPNAHYFKYVAKRYSWLALISLAVMGVHTWLDVLLLKPNRSKVNFFTFIGVRMGMEDTIFYGSALIAIIFAFVLFSFLWKKKEAYSTLSLGVSPGSQFLIRYLFGAGLLLLTYIPSFAASYIINITRCGGDEFGITDNYAFNYTLMFCAIALAVYTLASLTAILSGRFIDSAISIISLLAAPYALGTSLCYILSNFLHGAGFAHNIDNGIHVSQYGMLFKPITDYAIDIGAFTAFKDFFNNKSIPIRSEATPAFGYQSLIDHYSEMTALPVLGFIMTIAVTAILALAAYFCFIRRPAECSGKAGSFPAFYCTAGAIAALGTALPIFMLPWNRFLLLILYCAAFSLVFFILTAVYNAGIKSFFSRYKTALASVGAVFLCALVCNFGGLGYSYRVPDAEDVDQVIMEYIGNPVIYRGGFGGGRYLNLDIVYYDKNGNPINVSTVPNSVKPLPMLDWYINLNYVPKISYRIDIENAIEIHKSVINDGIKTRGDCKYDSSDPSMAPFKADWRIVYILHDGRKIERYYEYITFASAEKIAAIEESYTYRDFYVTKRLKESDDPKAGAFQLENQVFEAADEFFSDTIALHMLSVDEKYELFKALTLDFADLSFEERYFSDDKVIGTLRYGYWIDTANGRTLSTHLQTPEGNGCNLWYVTEKYTRTLDFLERKDLLRVFNGDITVEKVEISDFDPYLSGGNPTGEGALLLIQSYENVIHTVKNAPVTEIPESEWKSYISSSRAIAGTTRGGILVRITYTSAKGVEKVIDRLIPNE